MIIVKTAISVCRSRKKRATRREPSDRLSSIKTINLMHLKRIKGKIPAERSEGKKRRDEIVYMRSALRFQLIRNYVILIDLIRLISYLALIFRRLNYISICCFLRCVGGSASLW